MFWTWDTYGAETAGWRRATARARELEDPLAHFLVIVDRLLCAACAGFVLSIVALLAG